MSRIPSEIIEQILLQSPAKSLVRFKSVSKEWKSMISNAKFIKTHTHQLLHQPPKNKLLAVSTTKGSLYSIKLTIENIVNGIPVTRLVLSPMRWSKFLGSCNGLILALNIDDTLFMMNPTTHDLWNLPFNRLKAHMTCVGYGFGYDSLTDDYKVLSVCSSTVDGVVNIYSLRNNYWRKVSNAFPNPNDRVGRCALVNGKCHWLGTSSIIAFSLVDELFTIVKLPNCIQSVWGFFDRVVEIGGKLGVYLGTRHSSSYELWVMQEYGDAKSWTRVCYDEDFRMPVCFVEGSDRDIVSKGICGDAVVVFNMDERRAKKVPIDGGPKEITSIEGTFVESIESIKRINTIN